MPKTIDNKCREGKHKLLRWIGNQEGVGNVNGFYHCCDCYLKVEVTDKYRKVLNDVYELISEEK